MKKEFIPPEDEFNKFIYDSETRFTRNFPTSYVDDHLTPHDAVNLLIECRKIALAEFKEFLADPIVAWLRSYSEIDRAWKKTHHKRPDLNLPESWIKEWAERRILNHLFLKAELGDRHNSVPKTLVHLAAMKKPFIVDWKLGIISSLKEYIYTNTAHEMAIERKKIEGLSNVAIAGLEAIQQLRKTHLISRENGLLSKTFRSLFPASTTKEQIEIIRMIGNQETQNFYPLKRLDATSRERLLVTRLYKLHKELFRTGKIGAISHILDLPFIERKLDTRSIEIICSKRRFETENFGKHTDRLIKKDDLDYARRVFLANRRLEDKKQEQHS